MFSEITLKYQKYRFHFRVFFLKFRGGRLAILLNLHFLFVLECFNSPYGTKYFQDYSESIPDGPSSKLLSETARYRLSNEYIFFLKTSCSPSQEIFFSTRMIGFFLSVNFFFLGGGLKINLRWRKSCKQTTDFSSPFPLFFSNDS